MFSNALGFMIVFIILQIGVTLFVWLVNLLNAAITYSGYIANSSELIKHAIFSLLEVCKECIAFICIVAVMRSGHQTSLVLILGLILTSLFIQRSFHEGLKLLIRLHIAFVFLQTNMETAVENNSQS